MSRRSSGGLFDPYDIDNDLFRDALVLLEETDADNPVTRDFRFIGTVSGDIKYDPRAMPPSRC
jgi:hypothetical protein